MRNKLIGWLAILFLIVALAIILYALIPSRTITEIIPLTPTFFVPPAAT